MIKDIDAKQLGIQQKLTIAWVILSVVLLFLVTFYEWQSYRDQKINQARQSAQNRAFQFDEFVENLLQTTFSVNFSDAQFRQCNERLLPILHEVIFNNPNISAITVSNKALNLDCSTINDHPPFLNLSAEPHLHGPIDSGGNNKPVYILQQRLGHYHFTLYILKNIFENLFLPLQPTAFNSIVLYDNDHQKSVLDLQAGTNNPSEKNDKNSNLIQIPSQTLDDFQLLFTPKVLIYDKEFLYKELVIIVVVLFFSLFFYLLLRKILNNRFSLNHALINGLKHSHFEPIYQPIMDVSKNRFCGAEVLVRWQMESRKLIMPDLFIEEAEDSGLIVPITLQLVEKTFHQCQDLLQGHPYFHLAFNLSAIHFLDKTFFDKFYELCHVYQINPEQIILELTERRLFDQNDKQSLLIMEEARQKGFSLAIDDFGTGHASINYLQHLPFNYLKIDKQFIQAIGTGAITETLNQAIINMAGTLNLAIIAEGVETVEQYEYLRQQKVDYIQGWYCAKAMSVEHLILVIQEKAE